MTLARSIFLAAWLAIAGTGLGQASPTLRDQRAAPGASPAAGCPYTFLSDMPFGAYCVYRGAAMLEGAPACGDDVVVIWSTHSGDLAALLQPRDVYLGFVEAPSFLVHAVATDRGLARMRDYRVEPDAPPMGLDGLAILGWESPIAPSRASRTLTMTLPAPLALAKGDDVCAFDTYRGQFVGLLDVVRGAPARASTD